MAGTLAIISRVLPVIFLILIGNLLHRFKFFKESTIDDIKKIVVNISLPALLFTAFAETSFEAGYLLIIISVFAVCGLMLGIGSLIQRSFKIENRYYPSLFSGFETGMMGYSVFVAVYGAENMYKLAVIDLGQVTFVFFVLISFLYKLNGDSVTKKGLVLSFIKSPVIISIIAGIIAGITGIAGLIKGFAVSNSVYETIKLASTLTVPLICLVIGYELKISLKGIGLPLKTSIARVCILLGIALAIDMFIFRYVLHLDNIFRIALYTMFLLPPPFVIPIFMKSGEGENKQTILRTISVNIILSLAAFIILIGVFPAI